MYTAQGSSKRIRAVSARPARSRPSSGNSKAAQKTEFIENVYGGTVVNFFGASNYRKSFHLIGSKGECQALSKMVPKNSTKDKEQLCEENLHLKKQINKLTEQMAILKGQMQSLKKPIQKVNKQLNMQFEKEMYWTGSNAHLVQGVKAQYEKLKQKYQEKCEECDQIKNDTQYLQIKEFKVYSQALENQNKRLAEKLEKLSVLNDSISSHEPNKQAVQYILGESEEKVRKFQRKLSESQNNLKTANEVISDRDKKIAFLQKLIIEKDNNQYHAQKKVKKLQKDKSALEQELADARQENKNKQEYYENKLDRLQRNNQKKFEIEKDVFDRTLFEKESKIQKLEKEVAYLSTLLSYWKPLDEANKEVADQIMSKEGNEKEENVSMEHSSTKRLDMTKSKAGGNMVSVKDRRGSAAFSGSGIRDPNTGQMMNFSRISQIQEQEPQKRVKQTADKRHSEEAQKKRKVTHDEIEETGLFLKYRFIGQNLTIYDVKQCFDYKSTNLQGFLLGGNEEKKSQAEDWDKEYISMKEVIKILQCPVFDLADNQAYNLARYLVEDSNNEYIYCDQNNEIERSILKSIIKAVVGDYQIYDSEKRDKIEFELNDTVTKYKDNLGPALKTVAPSGVVSQKKYLEMITSLGIEISDDCKQLMVAKMALKSSGLNKLNYTIFF